MTSRTVWVVGEADDYIAAVFTTEEAAEAFRARKSAETNSDDWWVDGYPLDPEPGK